MSRGVVLLNMGGPNNLNEVELFLTNMFNDENILTIKSNLLRSFIAKIITLSRRKEATHNYETLGGKSPLVDYTIKLQEELKNLTNSEVVFAMRYTPPFAKEAISKLREKGVKELILIPLYPQYSTTTTKSSIEDFLKEAKHYFHKIDIVYRFYEDKLYNESLIKTIKEALGKKNPKDFHLIYSAHSLPQKIVDAGDPYEKEVTKHVEILNTLLKENNLTFATESIAYQSKLGPVKWLEPELAEALKDKKGKNLLIVPLSFTIDNSETEYELSIEYKEVAKEIGVNEYLVAKCPNDSNLFVKFLANLIS